MGHQMGRYQYKKAIILVYFGRSWQNFCVGMCWPEFVGKDMYFGVIPSVIQDFSKGTSLFN